MAETLIEWCDRVWNFLRGCSMISPGCANCYAMITAWRFNGPGLAYEGLTEMGPNGPRWNGNVRVVEEKINEPLHVKRPQRWFVNSMSDLFHENVPVEVIDRSAVVMARTGHHIYQILTKRPMQMWRYSTELQRLTPKERSERMVRSMYAGHPAESLVANSKSTHVGDFPWPLPNVWWGVSVEDRKRKDRIDILRETPAAVRFISFEPLLEDLGELNLTGIHWAIIGGESGDGARPCDRRWIYNILDQCKASGVKVFLKQLGARSNIDKNMDFLPLMDRKGGDPAEWPESLPKLREFPIVEAV